jgi:hypothetical protein
MLTSPIISAKYLNLLAYHVERDEICLFLLFNYLFSSIVGTPGFIRIIGITYNR